MRGFFQGQLWENFSVYVWAMLAGVSAWGAEKYLCVKLPDGETLYSSLVALGGVFAAFTVSIKTFVLSNSSVIKALRDNEYVDLYLGYVQFSVNSSILLCLVSISGFSDTIRAICWFDNIIIVVLFASLCGLKRLTKITILLAKTEA